MPLIVVVLITNTMTVQSETKASRKASTMKSYRKHDSLSPVKTIHGLVVNVRELDQLRGMINEFLKTRDDGKLEMIMDLIVELAKVHRIGLFPPEYPAPKSAIEWAFFKYVFLMLQGGCDGAALPNQSAKECPLQKESKEEILSLDFIVLMKTYDFDHPNPDHKPKMKFESGCSTATFWAHVKIVRMLCTHCHDMKTKEAKDCTRWMKYQDRTKLTEAAVHPSLMSLLRE